MNCINCGVETSAVDEHDFPWCTACYGIARGEMRSLIHNFEMYLECWAAYRDWEEAHPVIARILNYTERTHEL